MQTIILACLATLIHGNHLHDSLCPICLRDVSIWRHIWTFSNNIELISLSTINLTNWRMFSSEILTWKSEVIKYVNFLRYLRRGNSAYMFFSISTCTMTLHSADMKTVSNMMTSSNGKFFALLTLCAGNSPVNGEFPHKGQWRGALLFSLIYARTNGWVNNRDAGNLRRHRSHYDVTVMNDIQRKGYNR